MISSTNNNTKPTVEPIKIKKEKLEELNKILSSPLSRERKKEALRVIAGRGCAVCGLIPTKKVTYDYDGAGRIERYCDSCFSKSFGKK